MLTNAYEMVNLLLLEAFSFLSHLGKYYHFIGSIRSLYIIPILQVLLYTFKENANVCCKNNRILASLVQKKLQSIQET